MASWLSRLLGYFRAHEPAEPASTASPVALTAPARPSLSGPPERASSAPGLRPDDQDLLEGFLTPADVRTLDGLPEDDRLFLAGIRSLWRRRELELPVLPEAAVRLRALLQKGDAAVGKYAELLEQDSALSVEVLTAANSAAYGGGAEVHSLRDAIVRIGLQRLEGILLMSQIHSKVLKAGAFQRAGEVLVQLAGPLSHVASARARRQRRDEHVAFTRGTLWHVEHLVIVGALSTVSRDHRRALQPSRRALHQAFEQFGPDVRQAVARAWRLDDLLIGGEDAEALRQEYAALRRAIVCRWLGRELMQGGGLDGSDVEAVLKDVPARAA